MSDFSCACCGIDSDKTSGVYFCDECDNEEYSEEYELENKKLRSENTILLEAVEMIAYYKYYHKVGCDRKYGDAVAWARQALKQIKGERDE